RIDTELHGRAGAGGDHVEGFLAEHVEDWFALVVHFLVAAHEDDELSLLGLRRATGDRGVKDRDVGGEGRFVHLFGGAGGDGAHLDEDRARSRRRERTVGPEHHVCQRRVVGYTRQYHVDLGS